MWEQLAGGAIGMGIDLATQPIKYELQYKQAKKLQGLQIEGNKELSDYNAGLAYDMWQKTNYSAQRKELEKAGLNPALIYAKGGGAGGTTNAGSGGSISGQQAETPKFMGLQLGLQAAQQQAQIELTKAQAENVKADTENKEGVEREGKVLDNVLKKYTGKTAEDFYNNVTVPLQGMQAKTYADEYEARQATASNIYELWKDGKLREKSDAEIESILKANAKSNKEREQIEENIKLIKANTKGANLNNIIADVEAQWSTGIGLKSGDASKTAIQLLTMLMMGFKK